MKIKQFLIFIGGCLFSQVLALFIALGGEDAHKKKIENELGPPAP